MSYLIRPDLNQVPLDADSFLGRVIGLGRQFERLPERFLDTLMAFLRIRGREQAQRRRTGIRIERENLERGIKQAVICMELALEEEAGEDVDKAVEVLARGEFELLYKHGWELAAARLIEMRTGASQLLRRPEAIWMQEFTAQVRTWTGIVPETWTGTDQEGEEVRIDPQEEFIAFQQVCARLAFLRSLPQGAMRELLKEEEEGGSFARLLRRLILAVGLERESLVIDEEQRGCFAETCMVGGKLHAEVRANISNQVGAHLKGALVEERDRVLIVGEVEEALAELEGLAAEDLGDWGSPGEGVEEGETERLRKEAEGDGDARKAAELEMGDIWEMDEWGNEFD
jgi:hypothetical protein